VQCDSPNLQHAIEDLIGQLVAERRIGRFVTPLIRRLPLAEALPATARAMRTGTHPVSEDAYLAMAATAVLFSVRRSAAEESVESAAEWAFARYGENELGRLLCDDPDEFAERFARGCAELQVHRPCVGRRVEMMVRTAAALVRSRTSYSAGLRVPLDAGW
jgi:hypothetical protein